MKINDDHMYHGAALTQIAEHPRFTAINAFKLNGSPSRSGLRVNDDIGVYLKYATKPKGSYQEYPFTFTREHLDELATMARGISRVYLALVCVRARQVCCLSLDQLNELIARRRTAKGGDEEQYVLLVTVQEGKSFRAYISPPGARKQILGEPLIIPRTGFPGRIFA